MRLTQITKEQYKNPKLLEGEKTVCHLRLNDLKKHMKFYKLKNMHEDTFLNLLVGRYSFRLTSRGRIIAWERTSGTKKVLVEAGRNRVAIGYMQATLFISKELLHTMLSDNGEIYTIFPPPKKRVDIKSRRNKHS